MPFLTKEQFQEKVASQLHIIESDRLTKAKWGEVLNDSNNSAINEIKAALIGRGYSLAQIATWARLEEFNTDIALFWALTKAAELQLAIPDNIKALDRRKELALVVLLDGDGAIIEPEDETLGPVGYGVMDTTDDYFTYDMDL